MNIIIKLIGKLNSSFKYWNYKRKISRSIANGLKLGKNVTIMPKAYIDDTYSFLISIGNNCSLSNGVLILAHDATTFKFTDGYTKIAKVDIKDNCYIGSNATILPGVTIGPNVLVAAGSVVNKDIPPNSCVAGVPARVYAKFDEFIENHKKQIEVRPSFNFQELKATNKTLRENIKRLTDEGQVYVKGFTGRFPYTIT